MDSIAAIGFVPIDKPVVAKISGTDDYLVIEGGIEGFAPARFLCPCMINYYLKEKRGALRIKERANMCSLMNSSKVFPR